MTGFTGVVDLLDFGASSSVVSGAAVKVAAEVGVVGGFSSQKEEAIDLRVSFLLSRTRHKMVADFDELYRRIEEECEPVAEVLQSLGFLKLADRLVFYRFRKRCLKWGVWVSAEEFSGCCGRKYFDTALITHWRDLREFLEKGMVPALTVALLRGAGAVKVGEQDLRLGDAVGGLMNRRRLKKLPLQVWVRMGFSPTEIWRFLEPFLPGLRWWQVYLHLREVRKGLSHMDSRGPVAALVHSDPRPVVVPLEITGGALPVGRVESIRGNGLLDLFGDLPSVGRVDEFLLSEQAAKLRSGAFWAEVGNKAGASFSGQFQFGGQLLHADALGDLPVWCEEFALRLSGCLGFKGNQFRGAMNGHPGKYSSFHGWYLVLGHLLESVWMDKARRDELSPYFRQSRIRIDLPRGAAVELASLEEALFEYLSGKIGEGEGFALLGTGAVNVLNALPDRWQRASILDLGFSAPWVTQRVYSLFVSYSDIVFGSGGDRRVLEEEVKRRLFKPGTF